MKIKRKTFVGGIIATLCACTALTFGAVFTSSATTANAYTTANMPTNTDAIGNLYDSNKEAFSSLSLDKLAKKAGYANFYAMISAANNGEKKTSADFGETVVDFGFYGDGALKWIPVYLSQSNSGDAILTLWLANTLSSNDISKSMNQEVATWSDGTNSSSSTGKSFNGATVFSSTYDGSYIRNYVLNGNTNYTSNWGEGSAVTPPMIGSMTKFTQFTTGALSSYLVTPSELDWQINAGYMKNDPAWTSSGSNGKTANYPHDWVNDKVWLPSVYEVYDNTLTANSPNKTFTANGGLWKTMNNNDRNKVSNSVATWLRSANPESFRGAYSMSAATGSVDATSETTLVNKCFAVRPAIHLNLNEVAANIDSIDAPSNITTTKAYDGNTAKPLAYNDTQHTLSYLAPDWYLEAIYTDADLMEVTYEFIARGDETSTFGTPQINGSSVDDGINSALKADPATASNLKNAGKYKVTLKLKSDSLRWSDDTLDYTTATAAQKELQRYRVVEYEIKPKQVNVSYSIYDTSGATPAEKSGTSVVYTTDTTKTYKVDIKTVVTTESIPTGTPTTLFPDYEIVYSGTANDGTTTYTEVSTAPRLAGSYTAKFKDKNAKTSNYELKCAQASFAYTVDKAEVTLPTFNVEKHTYNANEQDFALTGTSYDTAIVKIDNIKAGAVALTANEAGTEYKSADEYFVVKYDATNKKFTATNAADYKVTFALVDSNNYKWATALATTEKAKTFTVEKKELVIKFKSPLTNNSNFNLKTSTTGNVTAEYNTNGGGETPTGGSAEEPVLLLYYTFASGSKVLVGSSSGDTIGNFSLDVTTLKGVGNKFSAGTYSLAFELAPEAANAVNKNYKLGTSAAQALTVTAGEASIDDIGILYNTAKKEADGESAVAIPEGGLKYEYDSVSKQATEYKFELDFSNIKYLTYAGTDAISLQYNDDSTATQAINAGKLTVTVKIKVKDEEAANHSLPASFDVTQTNTFKSYLNNGDGTATLTFEIEIGKHEITVAGSDIPLKYQREGGQVTDYDPKNPPEFNGKPVTISLPDASLFPHGVKKVEFDDATPKKTQAGKYTIGATITLDDNHCLANGNNTLHVEIPWEISKEVIKIAWGKPAYFDEYFNDSSVAHLQVMLLSGLTEEKEKAIKYTFYKTVDGAPDTTPLSEAELKALCTNDRFTDPNETWLYVKAELTEEGAKKYVLEDDATKNPKRFKLGGQMTLIELKVDEAKLKGYEYGGALDLSKAFTLINTETGDAWDSSYYEIRVFKNGVDIGEISEFNPAENDAGKYVIEINIKPEYADSYTLDKSNTVDFEIHRKEIALPAIGEILFSGEYINLADYLGGSYSEYKDIISLSGDYRDLRNVSQSGYKARLVLTDPNYKWAKPATVEPASLKLFAVKLFDNELAILDDVTAELKWNIAPLVIDVSELWTKGKSGATLSLPENITKLIDAETLSVLYRYYDDADQYIETPELKGGKSFRVEAVFGGIDAEAGNVLFKKADGSFGTVSDRISYTVPQSAAEAFFGSAVSFLKANWLWVVIAVAALILLIMIIALAARSAKKKRIREEQRRLEEKEERERKEEERKREQEERRREDREERMARLNQQQAMPQMMMPQMMPQMMGQMQMPQMPQSAQPAATGGAASSNEIAELRAEISTLRAEQSAMRTEVALRAEQAAMKAEQSVMHSEISTLRSDNSAVGNGQVMAGMTAATLAEIVTAAVKSALAAQPVESAKPEPKKEEGAVAQVPPDAVMTTVTTTKIDTTKKPAQNAQAQSRPIVRSYVAPMPVDDGRVFDVGGFYTPADSVDLSFDEEEKK